jgi:N-acetylglucosaminyldiphosphoundecaprenol N-acetyl-beta-D-mannosaminyltransferase
MLKALLLFTFPRWVHGVIPERVSGSDLVPELVKRSQVYHLRVALVGGGNGVAARAANVLVSRFPKAQIVLTDQGLECTVDSESRLRYDTDAQRQLLLRIADARPDIVFVGFGQRKQEKWIAESFRHLPHVKLFMGVGGTFDMLAGSTARAPKFFQTHSIEWVWRWMLQPWRVGRIFTATMRFMIRVGKEKYGTH